MDKLNRYVLSIFLVSLMVSSILINVSISAKSDKSRKKTTVYIHPQKTSNPKLGIGETFTVDVKINNVDDLYAFEFKLKYNPEILDFVGISSSFLNSPTFDAKKTADETSGIVWLATSSTHPASPKTGSGTLATITFQVKGMGESILDIYYSKLLNSDVERISHVVKDGYFKNGQTGEELEVEILEEEVSGTCEGCSTGQSSIVQTTGFSGMTYMPTESCADGDVDTYFGFVEVSCESGTDCDDSNPLTNPDATEICDRKDNDCDGHIDETDVCCSGDVNHIIDTETNYYNVTLEDLTITGQAYGSEVGQSRYDNICISDGRYCDLNDDGVVDIFDLAKIGKNYGNSCLACIHVTVHVQNELGQPLFEAWLKIFTGAYVFVEEGSTDIYGNYKTTCLEDGPYMYELTTPVGCEKAWAFDLPDDTYVLIEPPWDKCPS